jgi:hypothetical protein
VLATQYAEGGGLEWGGRFLSPLTAPLAAIAAVVLLDRVAPAMTVLAVTGAVAAVLVVGTQRRETDEAIHDVEAHLRPVVITTQPALPRLAWRIDGRVAWLMVEPSDVARLADELARRKHEVLVVAGDDQVGRLPGLVPVPADELRSGRLRLLTSP